MFEEIDKLLISLNAVVIENAEQKEQFRLKWLSKKGIITEQFEQFKNIPNELKKQFGQKLNELKLKTQEKFDSLSLEQKTTNTPHSQLDLTIPTDALLPLGSMHPISIVKQQIISIFSKIGFDVSEGPEIEDDWHNFTALNTPLNHPARDMQDTFYVSTEPPMMLRTQTSSVQIHLLESKKLPIRTISPGRVYRNEAISARAHCQFHQVEGLYVDTNVSFADMKSVLSYFTKSMFGNNTKIRMRPSYFPFTEPSAEVDISCSLCKQAGCNVCKYTGWVEIMGCGMVDPQVFENCKIDSTQYSGFAFGMGIERLAMMKYKIKDLRLFYENDIRFLSQFKETIEV